MPQQPLTRTAKIKLLKRTHNGKDLFAVPVVPGVCDGKSDGASCGPGCTCIAGQPHYDVGALSSMGITLPKARGRGQS
jgi:hypothetical protein